jgi:hypothetical protein
MVDVVVEDILPLKVPIPTMVTTAPSLLKDYVQILNKNYKNSKNLIL